jgi:hypothetical protein
MLHMGEERAAFTGQGQAAAQEVAGGAQLSGGDIGLRAQATAQQSSQLVGVDVVVFGLTAVQGFPRERMTKDTRDLVFSTQIGKPVPGTHAGGGENDLLAGGRHGLEQRLWGRGHMAGQACCSRLVEDTDVHGAGGQIDPAVKRVWCGGEAPEILSSRTKIFLYVKISSIFADSQPSLFTLLINKKDMLTGAIYPKFKPRNSQLAP